MPLFARPRRVRAGVRSAGIGVGRAPEAARQDLRLSADRKPEEAYTGRHGPRTPLRLPAPPSLRPDSLRPPGLRPARRKCGRAFAPACSGIRKPYHAFRRCGLIRRRLPKFCFSNMNAAAARRKLQRENAGGHAECRAQAWGEGGRL